MDRVQRKFKPPEGDITMNESPFLRFMRNLADRRTYLETFVRGNNGDQLILMGTRYVMKKAGCRLVTTPQEAQQIVFRGSGSMNDVWAGGVTVLERYRSKFPNIPLVVGPSTYVFRKINIIPVLQISDAPLTMFARDKISEKFVQEINLPVYVNVQVSQDLALELQDSDFIGDLQAECRERHILIAMRKDCEGSAGILARTKGTWLPKKVRRPLSRIRDRLTALRSRDVIENILKEESIPRNIPRVYRDVSVSISFDEFVKTIRDAALIITDRLHVGILGHMLNKRVFLRTGIYHKIKGVYELSLSGPRSRTRLYI